ncbi:MAG: DNA translocase FtsK 4TM domain-containing protein [Candidatus Kerfeldbacteria bacterium]|nr:DNA translocase FtsK 4TM domain-containing protein [Candidatus Kerfeldbacteria bacterium]
MAKRKIRKYEPAADEREDDARPEDSEPQLKPETRHGVLVVALFLLVLLSLLALFNIAGRFGEGLRNALAVLVGWGRWLVPVALAAIGVVLARPQREPIRSTQIAGGIVVLLAVAALLNLGGQNIDEGIGGGVLGALLWTPLTGAMGKVAATVVFIALLIIGGLLLLNTSLSRLFRRGQSVGRVFGQAKDAIREARERGDEEPIEFSRRAMDEVEEEAAGAHEAASASDEDEAAQPKPKRVFRKHNGLTFPLELLEKNGSKPTSGDTTANQEKIRKALENFGIAVEMGDVSVGPTVTQYTFKPAEGVKVSQITTLANDLALALAAHPIRIEAPIPGKSLIGIEVPNQKIGLVNLRELLESDAFKRRTSPLSFVLGRDVSGAPVTTDLDPMPHLLIAGATGSGKSVMINSLLLSFLATNSPDELKLILVDPKRVELTSYNNLPHLLTPVITDSKKTINALRWVVGEMDRRFQLLSDAGKRNIQTYHQDVDDGMPYLVVVIDELADLMAVAANEVEGAIVRLAQMARAVGIHLVVATQRPSVDVITGLIKANITARIAFTVASGADSRTILDHGGAEKLLGRGDMLFINADMAKPRRIQGAFVSEKDIEGVTNHLKAQAEPDYVADVVDKPSPTLEGGFDDLGDDELVSQAKEVILQAGKASASLLQRRLRIGYARAARVLDVLEEQGFIGPGEGAKPREILMATAKAAALLDEEGEEGAETMEEGGDGEDGEEADNRTL